MKRVILISSPPCGWLATLILSLSGGFASHAADAPGNLAATPAAVHDLTPLHDATRVWVNPDKGWYHHYPDNHPDSYKIARDADLLEFPGMDHVYLRLAWAYLEPKEGEFDWAVIDRIIDKWTAHGLGIAFRISCKETGTDRIEQQFATPRWVMEAGAQGGHYRMGKATGPEGPWEPVYDDPVFLAKLDNFLAAFAARYDRQPWLRYVDIGSIARVGRFDHGRHGTHGKETAMNESKLILEKETFAIRGACFEVYKEKGCGFVEAVYQECLEIEFSLQGILFVPQPWLELEYKGRKLRSEFQPEFILGFIEAPATDAAGHRHIATAIQQILSNTP